MDFVLAALGFLMVVDSSITIKLLKLFMKDSAATLPLVVAKASTFMANTLSIPAELFHTASSANFSALVGDELQYAAARV
jgi:hypothetical protein